MTYADVSGWDRIHDVGEALLSGCVMSCKAAIMMMQDFRKTWISSNFESSYLFWKSCIMMTALHDITQPDSSSASPTSCIRTQPETSAYVIMADLRPNRHDIENQPDISITVIPDDPSTGLSPISHPNPTLKHSEIIRSSDRSAF